MIQLIYFSISIYLQLETFNYYNYIIKFNNLNNYRYNKNINKEKIINRAKIMSNDYINHIKNKKEQILDLFYGDVKNISNKKELYNVIKKHFYYPIHNEITDYDENIITIINDFQHTNNCNSNNNEDDDNCNKYKNKIKYIDWGEHKLNSWYKPVGLIICNKLIKKYNNYYLRTLGFDIIQFTNGLNIWFKKGTNDKACMFIHSSIGGLVCYHNLIKKLLIHDKNMTIFLPEIPGISHINKTNNLPSIYEMSNQIIDFINYFNVNKKINELNFIGHSFGCNIITCIINRLYDKLYTNINKIIIVEGCVLLPRLMKLYKLFNTNSFYLALDFIKNNKYIDILSILLFNRNLDVQYYLLRCLNQSDSILLNDSNFEKNNKIYFVMAENDDKISVKECEQYILSKQYNCYFKIFNDREHADFVFDNNIQQYVVNLLNK